MKTQDSILAELDEAAAAPIDYSGIPPMTEEEAKTAQFYYKDFLDKLPPDMVKELIERRLAEIDVKEKVPQMV